MNAAEFLRKRAIIEHGPRSRQHRWCRKAMQQLLREACAVAVTAGQTVIGYRLKNGQLVCLKKRYIDQVAAIDALDEIDATEGTHEKPRRAYPCPHCNGWHLTHRV